MDVPGRANALLFHQATADLVDRMVFSRLAELFSIHAISSTIVKVMWRVTRQIPNCLVKT